MKKTWRAKLKGLVLARKTVDEQIALWEDRRAEANDNIMAILNIHKVDQTVIAGYSTTIVRPVQTTLKEEKILRWYKKHKIVPPLRRVFDVKQFEEDIKSKKVPASILEKYSNVKNMNPHVRITKVK